VDAAVVGDDATDDGALLSVADLRTWFSTPAGIVRAVDGVTFDVRRGEVFAVVGESGSGKSMTALSVIGLVPTGGRVVSGQVRFDNEDLLDAAPTRLRQLRGGSIGTIFQDPMTSLNPVFTVGHQLAEAYRIHRGGSRAAARARAVEALREVGIADASRAVEEYPHSFSGGMRQRVMIAMAMICRPKLLIADEPTTALDVTIQAQILELLLRIRAELGTAILLITHDLGVVAGTADRVMVMYAGQAHEVATVDELFQRSRGPYTWGLLGSVPPISGRTIERLTPIPGAPPSMVDPDDACRFASRCQFAVERCQSSLPQLVEVGDGHLVRCARVGDPQMPQRPPPPLHEPVEALSSDAAEGAALLAVESARVQYAGRKRLLQRQISVRAVDGVSVSMAPGETVGLVGESGCGKSTLARLVVRLIDASEGSLHFDGSAVGDKRRRALQDYRQQVQMVFQDPYSSLNPRMTVGEILAEPLRIHGRWDSDGDKRIRHLLTQVGLEERHLDRYPHQFSGGQRQRIGIARALVLEPRAIVLDEPVSALDVSIQAQILNLLRDLQRSHGFAMLFIAHNLSVVRYMADRIAVMYLGRIVEDGPCESVFRHPSHPYTKALMSAVPVADPVVERTRARIVLSGEPPSPVAPPPGCRFHPRCWRAEDRCQVEEPALVEHELGAEHRCACHFADEIGAA
jgi:peptide/nickel transport system ATP-binding protein